jgi:hypothetical protein
MAKQRLVAKKKKAALETPSLTTPTPHGDFKHLVSSIQADLPQASTVMLVNVSSKRCQAYKTTVPSLDSQQLANRIAAIVSHKLAAISQFGMTNKEFDELLITTSTQQSTNLALVREVLLSHVVSLSTTATNG